MTAIVPSYIAKVGRAKQHLIELEAAIDRYTNTKPYTVRKRIEGKKKAKVWRLAFTSDPADTDIPIIAADVIYNLRSSLDHLMSALVVKKDRSSAIFPIYFQGVWETPPPGEDEQRKKLRARWASDTKSVRGEALAFLKRAQPPDDGGRDVEEAYLLRVLNRWSNRDRHEKLPVVAPGLAGMMAKITRGDGTIQTGLGMPQGERPFFKDHARLAQVPKDAVNVEVAGVPAIAIGVGGTERHLEIPEHLQFTIQMVENEIIPKLSPHVQPDAA